MTSALATPFFLCIRDALTFPAPEIHSFELKFPRYTHFSHSLDHCHGKASGYTRPNTTSSSGRKRKAGDGTDRGWQGH